MLVERLSIRDVFVITPAKHGDERGFFSEVYSRDRYIGHGIGAEFVQDNHSYSAKKGVVRGLHCQVSPSEQGKLVRVVRGSIWDVAVDARPHSPSYGAYAAEVLSAGNWKQLWVPPGFLHGFCTLEDDTEVVYKVTSRHDAACERGIIWNDPVLAIPWPVADGGEILSDKDRSLPGFGAAADWFKRRAT